MPLAWIVIAFLTSTAGFMFLRLRRGSFSADWLKHIWYGRIFICHPALQISTEVLNGQSYEFSVNQILDDLFYPIIWVVVLWMATTIKNSLQAKQAQSKILGNLIREATRQVLSHCLVANNSN